MRITYWTLGFLALFVLVAGSAAATHYRYGTLSWEPTGNANEVRFVGGQAWRGSAFGSPNVGDIVGAEGCISTGDGPCIGFYLKVNAKSSVNDWFSATFVDSVGNPGVTHTYSAPNNGGTPWQVSWGSCCRISQVSSGNYHVNNFDQSESLQTTVDLTAPPNSSPRSALPPINACPREAICTIPIPASDNEGDTLAFRLSSASEAGDPSYTPPGPPDAPNVAGINGATGVLTWDTHGATVGASSLHTLYSVQVMIQDQRTQTPLDFFIEILPVGVSPPYWVMPPTPCGETISAAANAELTFDVRAKSDDIARTVYVNHLGLPTGAIFPPVTPGNPASGVFTWTPAPAQAGTHLVVFAAEDDLGYPAPACPVTIVVNLHPPPVFTTPAACGVPATIRGVQGVPLTFPVTAQTINATRTVTIALQSGPSGLSFPTTAPGNPTSGLATWPSPFVGAPAAVFRATDNFGIRANCVVPFDIRAPMGQAFTLATWAGTATPAAIEYSSGGFDLRATDADVPTRTRTMAYVDRADLGLHAEGVTEWASLDAGLGTMTARGGSEIAMLSLANGAVVLHGVHQEAMATWTHNVGTSTARAAYIDRILVNGQDVLVPDGQTVTLPLPGGYVTLFERSTSSGANGVSLADNLVHVYLAPDYSRHEIILGSVILQAGVDLTFRPQARDILLHDDLRTGTDAGATRATALPLSMGVHDANMPSGDIVDAFVFDAAHGEKIVFSAQPAPGTYATGGYASVVGNPPPTAAPPIVQSGVSERYVARLYDPTGSLREESLDLTSGVAARVELNADITGQWLVVLARYSSASPANYTIGLTITPVPLLPQADALVVGDAAPNCVVGGPGIPVVGNGVWPGVVRDDDFADTYRFSAKIGEVVTATLKPGEDADGASMGIELYDRNCVLLASMMELTGLLKGEPRAVLRLPSLYTGDYYVRIVRLNGVANHYTQISVIDPHPSTSTNDALTSADAPAYPGTIAPPPVVFQGTIHEGDTGDAYRLAYNAGGTGVVAFSMSALSDVNVRLIAPGGYDVPMSAALTDAGIVWRFQPDIAGDYVLVITPSIAGGNYSVTWGQLPVRQP